MEKKKYFVSTPKNKKGNDKKKEFKKTEGKKDFKKSDVKKDFKKSESKKEFKKSDVKKDFKKSDKPFDKKPFKKDEKSFEKKHVERKSFKKEENEQVNSKETSNIRYYIYKCLYNIYVNKAFSNIEIDHTIRENNINELDAKLLTNIVYGTLSHNKLLNWEISKLSEKEPKEQAKIILLMSLYQMRYLDRIPHFAILNEAVSIAKKEGGDAMGKFVNAVLRESQRQNLEFSKEVCKDEYEYLSIKYNTPVWVVKMWEAHYGKAKTLSLLEDSIKEPPVSFRVNIHKTNKEDVLANNEGFVSGKLAANSLTYNGDSPITQLSEFKEGLISVQDESSQYVVEVLDPKENEKVLDMCAAPGSKTQYICELMNTCVCFDSTKLSSKEKLVGSFDKVLLDAPCLGLGVIRRKPDIALDLQSNKLDEITSLQKQLLEQAYLMLKDGGTLVYSTCSINKKENDSQVMEFLGKHKDMKRVFEKQIFPDEYNSDGFYICKMIKE